MQPEAFAPRPTIPLRTRRDLKNAGHAMAVEAVQALSRHLATLTQEQIDDVEHVNGLTQRMLTAAENVADVYRASGIPEDWVRKFLLAFRRTASAETYALSFILRPVAGTA